MSSFLLMAVLALGAMDGPAALAQETYGAVLAPFRTFFSVRSAKPDSTIPESLAMLFENYDGGPLQSLEYDLDGDGSPEKFILNTRMELSSGSQWLIYRRRTNSVLGLITGSMVFVLNESDQGFPRLETYWRQGGEMAVVFEYSFDDGKYSRQASRSLTPAEISEYFAKKPSLDVDKELSEIKSPPG